jgi:hypothetical protein
VLVAAAGIAVGATAAAARRRTLRGVEAAYARAA